MKAAVVTKPGQLELLDIPMPQPGAYDCLVKIDACAVCTGTDRNIAFGDFPFRSPYPFVLGHESTGIILETGKKVKNFKIGQRVTRPAAILSGETVNGMHSTWGAYAEYGLVRDVVSAQADGVKVDGGLGISRSPLPADVDAIYAALSINHREILSVTRRIPLTTNSAVVVIGSGYNGLLYSLFCKHFGAGRVVMAGNPVLAKLATERYHADAFINYHASDAAAQCLKALSAPPTHIIDAVGFRASLALAEKLLTLTTAFGCYGMHEFEATTAVRQELSQKYPALDMSTDEPTTVDEWHRLWKAGFFKQPGIYDRVMTLDQIHEAFQILARREAVKIVLEI